MSGPPAPEKAGSRPESPTTAKQLDFDDEPQDSTPKSKPQATATVDEEEAPPAPPKPPRSASPQQQAEHTLIEAFPSIDAKVVRAVLTASGGQVEPAFNALLGMSDPNFHAEEAPPAQPPRPTAAQRQLEQDEMYARQLAQQYQHSARRETSGRGGHEQGGYPPQGQYQDRQRREDLYADEHLRGEQGRERSFIDDDLPEIQESIRKGFIQTQNTVNSWFTNFKKRLDGDDNDDPYDGPTRQDLPPRPQDHSDYYGAHQGGSRARRSGDYDADPRELGDDFSNLELRDEVPPPKPARPPANPDLFKPMPAPPNAGPVDEVEAAERRSNTTSPASGPGQKKWQPLTSIAPQAESEDHDPFSVGDSDDEKDSKTKDVKEADTARLKEAARKSISEGEPKPEGKVLEESEKGSDGIKNKEAEELLAKK